MANQYLPHYTPTPMSTPPQQLFPQPQGSVYLINNSLEVANIPIGAGTPSIQLKRPGYYMVHFNASAAATATGDVTVQLNGNGSAIPGAISTVNSTAATDIGNLSFTAIVRVLPNCCAVQSNSPLTLTFVNTGVEAAYSNAAVTITRLS